MKSRLVVFLLFAFVGCALLGVILIASSDRESLSLSDLVPSGSGSVQPGFDDTGFPISAVGAPDFGWRGAVYGAGILAALFLALRVIVATARNVRSAGVSKSAPIRLDDAAVESMDDNFAPQAASSLSQESFIDEISTHFRTYARGLTGKMMVTFTSIVALCGLTILGAVYLLLTASLRSYSIETARLTAVNVSDAVPVYLLASRSDALGELVRKYGTRSGIAYVLVQDSAGNVISHSFEILPPKIRSLSPLPSQRHFQRNVQLSNGTALEVTAPILNERLGVVRVGVWQNQIDATVGASIAPLLKWIVVLVIGAIVVAVYLVWKINQPIVTLVRAARKISFGDLDVPGDSGVTDSSEYGDIARALERMRSSIRAAKIRLREEL